MNITINIVPDQLNDMIKASLVEYHDYLATAEWVEDNDYREKVRDAFVLVLEQYMSPTEYEKYMAKFIN